MLNVAIADDTAETREIIRALLSPWDVCFTGIEKSDAVICYQKAVDLGKPKIIVPSESPSFRSWAEKNKLKICRRPVGELSINVNDDLILRANSARTYSTKNEVLDNEEENVVNKISDDTYMLTVDVIEEAKSIIAETLNKKNSLVYDVVTSLPVSYRMAPTGLRKLLFSRSNEPRNCFLKEHLPLDALRLMLLKATIRATGSFISSTIKNKSKKLCVISHDIDSENGLRKAMYLKIIEEKYDFKSTWFIPTNQYDLNEKIIIDLVHDCELGSHGTTHDGKLIKISKNDVKKILSKSKKILETIIDRDVISFRAPLLQHNQTLFDALRSTGYRYDSSIPTWEPKHPSTFGPHGIGTIYPTMINGICEVPITVPQDHQMLTVLDFSTKETVNKWMENKKIVDALGGIFSVSVHPDYNFTDSSGLKDYEDLINTLHGDAQNKIITCSEISSY